MAPREAEMVSEWTGLSRKWSVKRFEWSWRLNTALYKNLPLLFMYKKWVIMRCRTQAHDLSHHYHISPRKPVHHGNFSGKHSAMMLPVQTKCAHKCVPRSKAGIHSYSRMNWSNSNGRFKSAFYVWLFGCLLLQYYMVLINTYLITWYYMY